nr:Sodium/proton antiporter NhaA [Candidatus Pantoea persica]
MKCRIATLPQNTTLADIAAVGVLCGIGFTMSIFITSLAYGDANPQLITLAKLGILLGSILSAVAGYLILGRCLARRAA